MKKITYEIVALEATKILNKILISSEESMTNDYYDKYVQYLNACGWTDSEFDKESLKRIDSELTDFNCN